MATTTNYSWTTPDDTALVKDGAAAIRSLGTAIDSTVFTNAGAAVTKATVDAKGDLIVGTADNTIARLAVGANDTILTADSSTATGLKWAAPAASGGITLITETVASALSSLTFGSIPQTYKELLLVWDGLTCSASDGRFNLTLNNDTSGQDYKGRIFKFTPNGSIVSNAGDDVSAGEASSLAFVNTNPTSLEQRWAGTLRIYNYTSTTKLKRYDYQSAGHLISVGSDRGGFIIGTYNSTSAITSIEAILTNGTGTFSNATNTSIRLYGIS